MKHKIYALLFIVIISSLLYPQERRYQRMDGHKKIDQLEKLKLMEILDLDEEAFIRFFSRHSEYKTQMRKAMNEQDQKLEEMETNFTSAKMITDKEYENMINNFIEGEKKILTDRETYLKSLSTILKPEQLCKLIVFEKRFREEIRDVLLRDRMRMKKNRER
ncbi:MAG: hypothetical protein IPM56_10145 [Ignavibacteriales bacterium]|nr:MAG: hypothetical protein IPM56_10145 [Ignavibacteriales bacterium]